MDEDTMFQSVSLCVIFPRGINTAGTGAFLLASCKGGGREVVPPTPKVLGFIPLINRVCQYKYEDIYIQDRRASVSLCDLIRCQNIVYLQYRYRHVRIRKGMEEG
jgi:hypothetical protein